MLAWPHTRSDDARRRVYRGAVDGTEVHTIHTEVEGGPEALLFEKILDDWRSEGVTFILLSELAREILGSRDAVPERPLARVRLRGRGGFVATGWPPGEQGPADPAVTR